MERAPVQSSNIAEIGYDPLTLTLEVKFHSGAVYRYAVVPHSIVRAMLEAPSIGGYFAEKIRNRFNVTKVSAGTVSAAAGTVSQPSTST